MLYHRGTDLKEHVVRCHGKVGGVQHQAFGEQREKAVAEHDLRLPPVPGIRGRRSERLNIDLATVLPRTGSWHCTTLLHCHCSDAYVFIIVHKKYFFK